MLVYTRRRLRGLPRRAAGHAAHHGRRSRAGRAPARREPLAVAAARHLQRDHHPRPRRVREGEPGRAVRRPALVHRPCRDHRRRATSTASPRSAAASPCSTAWPIQGEYFVERYGAKAAERTPPIRRMLEAGVPVGAGTDATRVASYNPWVSLSWLVTGKTIGGLTLYPAANRLDRETRPAAVDRGEHLVLDRSRQEGPDQGRTTRRSRRALRRLLLRSRGPRSRTSPRC